MHVSTRERKQKTRAPMCATPSFFGGKLPLQSINRFLSGLLALYVIAVLNCGRLCGGQIQTINPSLNLSLSITMCLLPAIILITHLVTTSTYRWWVISGLLLLAIPSTPLTLFCLVDPPKLVQSLRDGNAFIRCFRDSGFDFRSVDLEQQWNVMPGVVWSVTAYHEPKAENVHARFLDKHHLQCTFTQDRITTGGDMPKKYNVTVTVF